MKRLLTVVLMIATITSTNAQRNKKIKGNGNQVTIERSTQEYNGISVGGFFNVEFIEGEEGTITLKGEDNILEHIETKVINGTLTIKKRKNLNLRPSHGIGVFITVPVESINAILSSGAGKLYSRKALKADHFKIRSSGSRNLDLIIMATSVTTTVSGSCNIKLGGSTKKLNATSSGSSNLNAYEFIVDTVVAISSGSSNIRVTANESINVRASGSSNIKYKGNPEKVNIKTSGSANISKKN